MKDIILKAGYVEYDINTIAYDTPGNVTTNCNSITFVNYGTNLVTIGGVVLLQQNQSFSIDGNAGEIINKSFYVNFTGSGTNNLVTIKKNYF
jgi:hypothetical protein